MHSVQTPALLGNRIQKQNRTLASLGVEVGFQGAESTFHSYSFSVEFYPRIYL